MIPKFGKNHYPRITIPAKNLEEYDLILDVDSHRNRKSP